MEKENCITKIRFIREISKILINQVKVKYIFLMVTYYMGILKTMSLLRKYHMNLRIKLWVKKNKAFDKVFLIYLINFYFYLKWLLFLS